MTVPPPDLVRLSGNERPATDTIPSSPNEQQVGSRLRSATTSAGHNTWPRSYVFMSMAGWNKPDRYTHVRELILRGLAEGQLKPIVDKVFPLDQVAEAHRYLESNRQVGKVVVKP